MRHTSFPPLVGGIPTVRIAAAPAGEIPFPSARIPRNGRHVLCTAAGTNSVPMEPLNAHAWRSIADFLWCQWLDSFGLRRTSEKSTGQADPRRGPACGEGPSAVRLGVSS